MNFTTHEKDETILDHSKRILKRCSRVGPRGFALFDVNNDVAEGFSNQVADVVDPPELPYQGWDVMAAYEKELEIVRPFLKRWAKSSVFRFWWQIDKTHVSPGPEKHIFRRFLCTLVTGRSDVMTSQSRGIVVDGWQAYAYASYLVEDDAEIDFNDDKLDGDLDEATINTLIMGAMIGTAIMDRPNEYRISRNKPGIRERLAKVSSVTTISLSKPRIVTQPNPLAAGTGSPMPKYDYRGHWICAEHGKAKPGCNHDPVLYDGKHAVCKNCGNLITWREAGSRGDPNIQRRTTYRVVP